MPPSELPPIVARLDADVDAFLRKMEEVKAELTDVQAKMDELSGTHATPTVDLNDEADDEITTLEERLAVLRSERVEVPVEIDSGRLNAEIAAAEAKIAALTRPRTIPINLDVSGDAGGAAGAAAGAGGDGGGGDNAFLSTLLTGGGGGNRLTRRLGLGGLASGSSVAGLAGLSALHLFGTPALSVASAGVGAAAGGGLLAAGNLGIAGVGGGSDLAVMKDLVTETQSVTKAQDAYNKAVAAFGPGSRQATQAQQELNGAIAQLPAGPAGQAILQLANNVQKLKEQWDQATGAAKVAAANLVEQLLPIASTYIPLIAESARRNFTIIGDNIHPLVDYLRGPATVVFGHLEDLFAARLPTAIHAFTQGFELFTKTIDLASRFTGGFLPKLDEFLTRMNGADFGKWAGGITHLIDLWHSFAHFVGEAGRVVIDVLHADAGTGQAIIDKFTEILTKLHTYLSSVQGQSQVHNVFQAHKEEILAIINALVPLAQAFGHLEVALMPGLMAAVAAVLRLITPLINLLNSNPFTEWLLGLALISGKLFGFGALLGTVGKAVGIFLGLFVGKKGAMMETAAGLDAVAASTGRVGASTDAASVGRFSTFTNTLKDTGSFGKAAGAGLVGLAPEIGAVVGALVVGGVSAFNFNKNLADINTQGKGASNILTILEGVGTALVSPFAAVALAGHFLATQLDTVGQQGQHARDTAQQVSTTLLNGVGAFHQHTDAAKTWAQTMEGIGKRASAGFKDTMNQIETDIGRLPPEVAQKGQQAMSDLTAALQRGQAPGAASIDAKAIVDSFNTLNAIPGEGNKVMSALKSVIDTYGTQIDQDTYRNVTSLVQRYQSMPPPVQQAAVQAMADLNAALATGNAQAVTDAKVELAQLEFNYQATVDPIGQAGSDASRQFTQRMDTNLSNNLGVLNNIMGAYDNALGTGIAPILAAIGQSIKPLGPGLAPPIAPVFGGESGGRIGAGFTTNGPTVLVGEGRAAYPEYVIPTDPAHRSNATALHAGLTKALGMAGGGCAGGDCGGSCGGSCAKGLAAGGFLSGSDVPAPPSGRILQFGSIAESFGSATNLDAIAEYNAVKSWADSQAAMRAAMAGAGIGGSGPAVSGACGDWINQGLALAGSSARMSASCLMARAMNESGCDPNASGAGNGDINARSGHPSVGLMQFVPSTFAANSVAGCTDLMNPICQVAASAHCDPGNCGHGGYGCQSGCIVGMAGGGTMGATAKPFLQWLANMDPRFPRSTGETMLARQAGIKSYDRGGIWPTGTIGVNTSGHDEYVSSGGGGGVTLHDNRSFTLSADVNTPQARAVMKQLLEADRTEMLRQMRALVGGA